MRSEEEKKTCIKSIKMTDAERALMHLLLNSTNYMNGNLINSWYGYMQQFCAHVTNVTGQKTRLEIKNRAFDFRW